MRARRGLITRPPGLPWVKLLCKPRPGCDRMLPKRIWRAHNISTSGLRDYAGALAELEIARRGLPNDPRLFELAGLHSAAARPAGGRSAATCSARWKLDPAQLFYSATDRASVTKGWGAMPRGSLRWIARSAIVPDNAENAGRSWRKVIVCWKGGHPAAAPDNRCNPRARSRAPLQRGGQLVLLRSGRTRSGCGRTSARRAGRQSMLEANTAIILSRSFGEGLLARMTKDEARARTAFEAARAQQEKIVQAQPDYGPPLCVLGLIDAALGRKDLALDEGRRAIALTPLEKDVNNGSRVLQYFAITAAWAGEKELALQQLEAGLRAPVASFMLSYGALKLHPFWDPLRGDPRFEQICVSPRSRRKNDLGERRGHARLS